MVDIINGDIINGDIINGEQSETIKKQIEESTKRKKSTNEITSQFSSADYFKCGNDLYTQIKVDGIKKLMSVYEGGRISSEFRNYFKHRMMSIGMKREEIRDMLESLIGNLLVTTKKRKLSTRVCSVGGNTNEIWYDLTNDKWEYIKIVPSEDGSGWGLEKNMPYPMFYRWGHQIAQVYPERLCLDESKEYIWKMFYNKDTKSGIWRMKDENNKILKIISLISKFIPDLVRVIDITTAPPGYAKTNMDRFIKRIVDPSDVLETPRPERYSQEFVQTIFHHWLLHIDNCNENLSAGISDCLSRVVTGAHDSQRQLYTTDKDFVRDLSFHCVIINSTINPIKRPDLMERCLVFELDTSEEEKRGESEVNQEFIEILPKLLGSILAILSKAMWLRQNTKFLPIKHRMVEFIKWGYCIAETIGIGGNNFMDIYTKKSETASWDVVNENSIAKVLMYMVLDKSLDYEGTMTDLWVKLYSNDKELSLGNERDEAFFSGSISNQYIQATGDSSIKNYIPKSPDSLGKRIATIENDLKMSGIVITKKGLVRKGNKVEREIHIKKVS